jgi:prepilin-type N-terminal cleavage/methylation domain-containing protein
MPHHSRSAFTLIEIAIAVVIIGLLVGGIMVGRGLIRSSEMQSVLAESARYTQAVSAFRDKYMALPGDFAGATTIWGAADSDVTTCKTTVGSTALLTCNGDGNGRIMSQGAVSTTGYEQFRAWQHLANAKLIDGSYTGVPGATSHQYTIGTTIPASRASGAGWKLLTLTNNDLISLSITDVAYVGGDIPLNLLLWAGSGYFENSNRMGAAFSGTEASELDGKVDDGKGATGKIIGQSSTGMSSTCFSAVTYNYNDTGDTRACALVFKLQL